MSCKRTSRIVNAAIAAGGTVDVTLPVQTAEYALRVVDAATLAGVAFTFAYLEDEHAAFHFAAAESWLEEGIGPLPGPLVIRLGAAVAARVELLIWSE